MKFLKKHPFPVEAHFENSTVLTFAVSKDQLQKHIPPCLSLDTYKNKWAFIAIAMVQTTGLRPKGFPKLLGNNFFLIGYRIFVRFKNKAGKNLRGLYILKSETNKKKMKMLGNIFTQYKYTTTDININIKGSYKIIKSEKSNFKLVIEQTEHPVEIPTGSPFSDWKSARRFAGPLPFTFTYLKEERSILIIEGVRQNWKPKAIKIIDHKFEFLNNFKFKNIVLGSAFEIKDVPYHWKKGNTEPWN